MFLPRIHGRLLAGVTVLALAGILIWREFRPAPVAAPPANAPTAHRSHDPPDMVKPAPSRRPVGSPNQGLPPLPPPITPPHPPESAEGRQWIADRVEELNALAWFDDPQSLLRILAELRNPLPEIHAAALAATVAFGSRDAIPYLETLAAESRDPQQQHDLTEAAAFLKLPTLIERLDQPEPPPPPPADQTPAR